MASADNVEATWTFHHNRIIAKPKLMNVSGALIEQDAELQNYHYDVGAPIELPPSEDPASIAPGHCFCGRVQLGIADSSQACDFCDLSL